MITDPHVYIDSHLYPEAEYQGNNELIVFCSDNRQILVLDVSEKTFNNLSAHPEHEVILHILRTHPRRIC